MSDVLPWLCKCCHGDHLDLLCRFLNADNEMKKIFGSRVVRAEAG